MKLPTVVHTMISLGGKSDGNHDDDDDGADDDDDCYGKSVGNEIM